MLTEARVIYGDAREMQALRDGSIDLVVTSPPYPMIEMWDELFCDLNPAIGAALRHPAPLEAFKLMHRELDLVWDECFRLLGEGGFACINIGDATRSVDGHFALYPNHVRIVQKLTDLGFTMLPAILWRKPTNSPNKFMGSGMLPAGAYVTLEHEYVLIARKGGKRVMGDTAESARRRASAFFWEERNAWFSDVWFDIRGTIQALKEKDLRRRSAAFPFELAYRLINMYALEGDTVLDPFLGTGTTLAAAMAAGRNSVGFEMDEGFAEIVASIAATIVADGNSQIRERLNRHLEFVKAKIAARPDFFKHTNRHYGFPVKTRQERDLLLNELIAVDEQGAGCWRVTYAEEPQADFCGATATSGERPTGHDAEEEIVAGSDDSRQQAARAGKRRRRQGELF